ncbi:hypothetical protein [Niallia taxi]|uniref:hypothetical protein n=1 Tax=Niallia taxi TaxID=2499688 RepID=UPI00300B4BE3
MREARLSELENKLTVVLDNIEVAKHANVSLEKLIDDRNSLQKELNKERYIDNELKKWEEKFIIPFEQEFEVAALIGLQYQYNSTQDDHIKTKTDIIQAMSKLKSDLNLKRRTVLEDKDKPVTMFIGETKAVVSELTDLISKTLGEKRVHVFKYPNKNYISTDTDRISIYLDDSNELRGKSADVVYRVKEDRESVHIKKN